MKQLTKEEKLINECKYLLRDANPNGNSFTDRKNEWKGMFTVHGNVLEEISYIINDMFLEEG